MKLTPEAATDAAMARHEAVISADDTRRNTIPTQADVNAALEAAKRRMINESLDASDPLQVLDASLEAVVLKDQRSGTDSPDAMARRLKLRDLRMTLANGDASLVSHEVQEVLEQTGTVAPEGSPEHRDLVQKLIRAEIEALQRTLERDEGNFGGHPTDKLISDAMDRATTAGIQRDAAEPTLERFLSENPGGVKESRLTQMRRDVGLFLDTFGAGTSIASLDKRAVRDWKALLMQWPVKATETAAFRGLSMSAVIAANTSAGKPTISAQTINRHLSSLSAFCNWCVSNGYLETNPVQGMQLRKVTHAKRATFTTDQLNTLFKSPLYTGCEADGPWRLMAKPGKVQIRDHRYWLPLIMLFSGARPAEIGQLETADVRQEHGTWIMHITTEGEGDKSTKTAGSMRVVPVHSELIKLGFLDYHKAQAASGSTRLFPNAKRNDSGQMLADYSREFSRYLSRIGMGDDHGLSLYSFRHGAADALRRAGYLDEQFGYILGHTNATMTGRYGNLPEGMLKQRVELIEAIEYENLTLLK